MERTLLKGDSRATAISIPLPDMATPKAPQRTGPPAPAHSVAGPPAALRSGSASVSCRAIAASSYRPRFVTNGVQWLLLKKLPGSPSGLPHKGVGASTGEVWGLIQSMS